MREGPNGAGLSRKHILDQAEASLDRLGTDYIDLYQIHRWHDETPIEETLAALDHLVERGRVRYIGASTMSAYQFTKALYTSDIEDYSRFVCMQPEYSAVARHEEANLLPVCDAEDIGVIPWSPLSGGFLTGKYQPDTEAPAGSRGEVSDHVTRRFTEENWRVLAEIEEIAEARDATPAQVSLAWLLEQDVVTAPIIGPKSSEQLQENLGALDIDLTDDERERIAAPKTPRYPAE